ncbi:hypothetical protein CIK94_02000 [Prevotella sp. P4-51]|uniref:restriction endonuclease subunit S n=1 Tax=Prevotella sp. P4-51 TaxID=2024228 RepID=UPI000B96079B|nr:restriction endonuclease subunit S [Prevotella sp. P4-51]OYP78455.1 hypothetical protein CIK94_02000 [Prevotella sp. P4-51]
MNTKALRQKILDLAIHGKLVPQDPNDEPASVLLERIRAEKERLVKEGKIKRPKKTKATSDKPHYENKLPNGWCLTNIGELLINRDGERKPVSSAIRNKQKNKVYNYYGAAGIIDKVDGYLFNERLLLIGEDGANLLSRSKDNAFFADGKYWVNNHAHVLDAIDKNLLDFVAIVINAMKLDDYITGSAQPKLSQDNLNKIPIALPPLYEQIRIVAKLKYWFSFVDWIEYNKGNLQDTIKQVKSKVLDLAIHGKLVPQDPTDEPASELLKRINPKAEITCDNGHYQKLPEGWVITPMQTLCALVDGEKQNGIERINLDVKYLRGEREAKVLTSGKYTAANTLLILVDGENSGEVFRAPVDGYQGSTFKQLSIHEEMYTDYVLQVINLHRKTLRENKVGSAIPHLNKKLFKAINVPIPPYEEQKRIVNAINQTFTILDTIMENL